MDLHYYNDNLQYVFVYLFYYLFMDIYQHMTKPDVGERDVMLNEDGINNMI